VSPLFPSPLPKKERYYTLFQLFFRPNFLNLSGLLRTCEGLLISFPYLCVSEHVFRMQEITDGLRLLPLLPFCFHSIEKPLEQRGLFRLLLPASGIRVEKISKERRTKAPLFPPHTISTMSRERCFRVFPPPSLH